MSKLRPYGFRCLKCDQMVTEFTPSLVWATNMDHACKLLQEAIKGHDLSVHPMSDDWPRFKMVRFEEWKAKAKEDTHLSVMQRLGAMGSVSPGK